MLVWLLLLCVVMLLVFTWAGSRYLGTESPPGASLHEQVLPRQQTDSSPGRRVSGSHGNPSAVALICKPSTLANYLLKHCRTFRDYWPPAAWTWRASAALQSAYEACWPCDSPVRFVRDHLQLSDDGLVSLDWAVPPSQTRRRTSSHSTSPVLLIIPNSFGRITRTVLKVMSRRHHVTQSIMTCLWCRHIIPSSDGVSEMLLQPQRDRLQTLPTFEFFSRDCGRCGKK